MTYEQIQKANESITRVDVKGKMYAEVNQRIKAFRMVHPDGGIVTDIVSLDDGVCVIKATVLDDLGRVLGTGFAYEKENSTFINKTSYIENCETSAVGRALGMCGFGIDTSVCSYEEVSNAILQQEDQKTASIEKMKIAETKVKVLHKRCADDNVPEERVLELYKIKDFSELTEKQFRNIADNWSKIRGM
jgi:hypothetical protein